MQSQYVFRIFAPRLARWVDESFGLVSEMDFFPRNGSGKKKMDTCQFEERFFFVGMGWKHQNVANIAVDGFSKSGSPVETYITKASLHCIAGRIKGP